MRVRSSILAAVILVAASAAGQDLLKGLGQKQDYRSRRVSSYDRSGGNRDSIVIEPGKTAVLAEIEGPGGHPSHLDDDRRRAVLRPEDRPPHLLGRREVPVGRGADRRLLRRRPRPEQEFHLPSDHLLVGGPGQELLLVHALPPLLPRSRSGTRARGPSTRSTITSTIASSPISPPTRPLPRPVPAGIPARGAAQLSSPRSRGGRPLRRLQPERSPAGHGLVGRGRRHDPGGRRVEAVPSRHRLRGLLLGRLGHARRAEPFLRLPPPGGGLPGRVQGHGLSLPRPRPRAVQEIHRGDDRARARERPRRSPLVRRLLVPDRAPPGLPAVPARRREAAVRLRAPGEFRPAEVGGGKGRRGRGLRRSRRRAPHVGAPAPGGPLVVLRRVRRPLPGAADRRGRGRDAGRVPLSGRGPRSLHDRAPFSQVARGRQRPGPEAAGKGRRPRDPGSWAASTASPRRRPSAPSS